MLYVPHIPVPGRVTGSRLQAASKWIWTRLLASTSAKAVASSRVSLLFVPALGSIQRATRGAASPAVAGAQTQCKPRPAVTISSLPLKVLMFPLLMRDACVDRVQRAVPHGKCIFRRMGTWQTLPGLPLARYCVPRASGIRREMPYPKLAAAISGKALLPGGSGS